MNKINKHTQKVVLSLTASILATCAAHAYEVPLTWIGTNMPPIDFHGFLSQGFLDSTKYNYLGDTTRGSFNFTEAGVNASINPFPHTRITAQGFLFDTGKVGEYDPALDYALVDYNFSDAIGVRGGRIIRPEGIYNSIQSIDLARTSVLLPQGLYDARYRDYSGSVDGGSVYGDISLAKSGDISYEVYAGMVNVADNGGIARLLQDDFNHPAAGESYGDVKGFPEVGGQFWWNTPLNGFRVGLAGYEAFGFGFDYTDYVPLSSSVDATEGLVSLEYVWNQWTFQAENLIEYTDVTTKYGGATVSKTHDATDAWYVGAAYRFNKWFEAGTYYTEDYNDISTSLSGPTPAAYQTDLALSLRFDPKPWWVIKVEGHFNHGTALLHDNASNPVANQNGDGWFMLAIKSTVSF